MSHFGDDFESPKQQKRGSNFLNSKLGLKTICTILKLSCKVTVAAGICVLLAKLRMYKYFYTCLNGATRAQIGKSSSG